MMKKNINILVIGCLLLTSASCKKFLDVNKNPNGPSTADPALYLPSIQTSWASGLQFDARLIAPYIQNFQHATAGISYDIYGYVPSSDFGGELWRSVYWKSGVNTIDLLNGAREQKKWDILGAGLAMQAWGWQMLTDYHGPIILKQAFDPLKNTFDYDPQDTVYAYVKRECLEAIGELDKKTDAIGSPLFTKFDLIYKGDPLKWKKFVYGILAINAHHLIKKPGYKPDDVIGYVDNALASNADDAIVPFNGTNSADANFFGTLRGNIGVYGQSGFIVRLMDGTIFNGMKDPRQPIMLNPSTDGVYRGLTPATGQSSTVSATASGVRSVWGTTLGINAVPLGTPGKYLFQDKVGFPLMTYASLQFIKAEAAFFKGDKNLALTAYKAGINASLDYVRTFTADPTAIAAFNTQRTAFLAEPSVVPTDPANLTISQIMLQKYIALWGYGFIETWTDLRKFDYDPNVYTSFTLPTTLYIDNNNIPAYRVRPRYNSEYIWNIDALKAIGGFDANYHTKKLWIHLP